MKVTLMWYEEKKEEVEMTPEEFCHFRSGETWDSYFPKNAKARDYGELSPEANNELFDFLYSKYEMRSE